MLVSYPPTLPEPLFDGFVVEPVDTILRTNMQSGPARQRETTTNRPTDFQLQWRLDNWDMAVWEGWFFEDARAGAAYFTLQLLNALGMVDHEVRFKGRGRAAYRAVPHRGGYWIVQAVMEARKRPLLDAGILALGKIEPIKGLIRAMATLHRLVHVQLPVFLSFDPVGPVFTSAAIAEAWEDVDDASVLHIAAATNQDGSTGGITYSLANSASGLFRIDAGTGEVRLSEGKSLDRETAASHQFTIRAADGTYVTDRAVSLTVLDRNDRPPVFTSGVQISVGDDAGEEDVLYTATVLDPDVTGGPIAFSLSADAGGMFVIDGVSGQVRLAPGRILDALTVASHVITIEASDQVHVTAHDVTINVTDAPNLRSVLDFRTRDYRRWTGASMPSQPDLLAVPNLVYGRAGQGEAWRAGSPLPVLVSLAAGQPRDQVVDLLTGLPLGYFAGRGYERESQDLRTPFDDWTKSGDPIVLAEPGSFFGAFSNAARVVSGGFIWHAISPGDSILNIEAGTEYGFAALVEAGSSGAFRAQIYNFTQGHGTRLRGDFEAPGVDESGGNTITNFVAANIGGDYWFVGGQYTPAVTQNADIFVGPETNDIGGDITVIGAWLHSGQRDDPPILRDEFARSVMVEPDALHFTGAELLYPAGYPLTISVKTRFPLRSPGEAVLLQLDDGTDDNRIVLRMTDHATLNYSVFAGGVQEVDIDAAVTPGADAEIVAIADAGNFSLSIDGVLVRLYPLGQLPAVAMAFERHGVGRLAGTEWGATIKRAEIWAGAQSTSWAAAESEPSAAPVLGNPPVFTSGDSVSVAENIDDTVVVYAATALDADAGDVVTFSLIADPDDLFEISAGGEVRLQAGKMLDYETKTSHVITVRASDGVNATDQVVTIAVTDVPDSDPDLRLEYDYQAGTYREWNGSVVAAVPAPSLPGETTGLGAIFPAGQPLTVVVDVDIPALGGTQYIFSLDNGGNAEQVRLYLNAGGDWVFHTRAGGSNTGAITEPAPAVGQSAKACVVADTDNFSLTVNGAEIGTDLSGGLFADPLTDLNGGQSHSGGGSYGGPIRSIRIYAGAKALAWRQAATA